LYTVRQSFIQVHLLDNLWLTAGWTLTLLPFPLPLLDVCWRRWWQFIVEARLAAGFWCFLSGCCLVPCLALILALALLLQ
jgi:hypothetical protein